MVRAISRASLAQTILLALGDLLIMAGSLTLEVWLRRPSMLRSETYETFAPLFAMWLVTMYAVGLYDLRRVRDFVELIRSILLSAFTCWILGTMYFYLISPYTDLAPKTHLLLTIVTAHVVFLVSRRALLTFLRFTLLDLRILLLAHDTHRAYLRVSAHRHFNGELNLVSDLGAGADLVVVDRHFAADQTSQARQQLRAALESRVPIVGLEDFYESLFGKVSPIYANELSWVIQHVLSRSGGPSFKLKRVFDCVAAATLLVLLSPLMALTALLVRVVDGFDPIFGQERVGHLRRTFTLWKFRTMRPGADAVGPFSAEAGDADPRVTALGRYLRQYRIDELPQLWNVVRGEMSLVGPRPEWIKEVEVLEEMVPTYHLRHLVLPGLTGWAQVYFRATNNVHDAREKHQYDLYYLKHFSVALDFSILLKTLKRVLISDSRVVSDPMPLSSEATEGHSVRGQVDARSVIGPLNG